MSAKAEAMTLKIFGGCVATIQFGNKRITLPGSRIARILIGGVLVIGGVLGFLPVLGFWMVPLGLIVLSIDLPAVRRWRRRMTVGLGRWMHRRFPGLWARLNGNGDTASQ